MIQVTRGKFVSLLLKNPPVNTLSLGLLTDLKKTLLELQRDQPRGLVFGSASAKVFSAGLDLKYLVRKESPEQFKQRIRDYMGLFQECVGLLISAPYPTVACLRGSAPAGGTVLGLCCDYRIAAKEEPLIMGLTEVFVGMAPPQWVHQLATNAIGHHKSKRVLMLGSQTLDPAQALKLGWIDETIVTKNRTDECPVPEWQDDVSKVLYGEALKHLEHYTSLPPIAQADVKRKANQSILDHITSQGLDEVVESIAGDEFQSTCNAILERLSKRK